MNTDKTQKEEIAKNYNVARYLKAMAQVQPFKRAVICPAGRDRSGRAAYTHFTFRQLDRESDCLSHGLVKSGITRGTRTILMVKPSLEFFALIFALFKVGAVPVVVDPGMGIRRMVECLKESRPKALVGIPPAHILRLIFPKYFKTVKIWVTIGKRWFWGGLSFKQIRRLPWKPFPMAETKKNETAAILFTTGSTGPAKGTIYPHGVFDAQVRAIKSQFGFTMDEIDLPTFPLFSLFDPALGITAVIPDMDPTKPARVNPRKIIEAIMNHGVTNMFASPALLNRVGRHGKQNNVKLPTLKRVISAGAPVSPANIEQFSSMFTEEGCIQTGYGATEAMPAMSIDSKEILSETRELSEKGYGICIGRPVGDIMVRVIQISDHQIQDWSDTLIVPDGEIGEMVVKGKVVTQQYFDRPRDDLLSKIRQDGEVWHRMGDLGWQDSKGRFWFCGRKSHRVITPEKTLFTVPCESIFNSHPGVFRSALIGAGKSPGQTPVICIERESGFRIRKKNLKKELLALAKSHVLTEEIETILFHRRFPVDIRHNSKIFREQLTTWAEKKLKYC